MYNANCLITLSIDRLCFIYDRFIDRFDFMDFPMRFGAKLRILSEICKSSVDVLVSLLLLRHKRGGFGVSI